MTDQQSKEFALATVRRQRQDRWKQMMRVQHPTLMRDVDDGKVRLTFLEFEGLINGVFESAQGISTWSGEA
jgi:hypothetical protein